MSGRLLSSYISLLSSRLCVSFLVGPEGVEPSRLSATVFKTGASAVPPQPREWLLRLLRKDK